jgi:ribosome-associated heat shock protein Hsp15
VSAKTEAKDDIRLDKWLWAARFFKTRVQAKAAVESNKVHYNKARAKPSRSVEMGAILRLQIGSEEKTIVVTQVHGHRRGAPEAQAMYLETDASVVKRQENAEQRKTMNLTSHAPDHRPNKKERRDLIRVKSNMNDS